jgi:hypothetical protein
MDRSTFVNSPRMKNTSRTAVVIAVAGVVGSALLVPAANASAPRGVKSSGACSATSSWKLAAKPDNGKIDVEFEVDGHRSGQVWTLTIKDNGVRVFHGTRTTAGASGSITVSRRIANRAGADHLVGIAHYPATGESCRGSVTL